MKYIMGRKLFIMITVALLLVLATVLYPHCQIPCGIYDDPARFTMMAEEITTIEKSMKQITELSGPKEPNMNQIVRWVVNKEDHADALSNIVTQYFMTQRIKPIDKSDAKAYEEYVNKLTLLHQMLVYSMKAKQTTDLSNVEKLRSLLSDFQTAYLKSAEQNH